jgi:2-polyprenyl-6-hydroxyphenyl methylase/3-demethylubiquinone-9 3-methyltransferase
MNAYTEHTHNVDPRELAKFEASASRWWDSNGEFKTLHDINPFRLRYIDERARLSGKQVIDVGCGGGILSEAMASAGATVTAIDASEVSIGIARLHQFRSGSSVDYLQATPEQYAVEHAGQFDVLTCMEMLEHVPRPEEIIRACAHLVKPDGHLFFSTLNRTPLAYALAVVGAEYVMNLLPKGTHDYARFIRPSELAAWGRAHGLSFLDISGMAYNPLTRQCRFSGSVAVNYLVHARLDHAGRS